ncbi:hypothetical protein AB0L64_31265 [Kribbella sp. NPDC051936]|uniref:hypothetical protein n=1 Tax=Kribbella sp. NPDC051936 TaxID=3154946 RepID=UPI00344303C7
MLVAQRIPQVDIESPSGDVRGVLQQRPDLFTQLGPDTIRGLTAEAPDVGPEVY